MGLDLSCCTCTPIVNVQAGNPQCHGNHRHRSDCVVMGTFSYWIVLWHKQRKVDIIYILLSAKSYSAKGCAVKGWCTEGCAVKGWCIEGCILYSGMAHWCYIERCYTQRVLHIKGYSPSETVCPQEKYLPTIGQQIFHQMKVIKLFRS